MLWLARFDSRPPPPGDEPVDLVTLAQACADRFRSVGPAVTADVGAETALMTVSWRHSQPHRPPAQRVTATGVS